MTPCQRGPSETLLFKEILRFPEDQEIHRIIVFGVVKIATLFDEFQSVPSCIFGDRLGCDDVSPVIVLARLAGLSFSVNDAQPSAWRPVRLPIRHRGTGCRPPPKYRTWLSAPPRSNQDRRREPGR